MTFHLAFTEESLKQLKKLDKHTSALVLGWLRKNIEGCENPRAYGKGLSANRSQQWRYRIGDYRVLAEIQDERVTVLVIAVGHRRNVYSN